MGAVATTSQKQTAGSSAEPTPLRMRRTDFARLQEMQTELQQVKFTTKNLKEDKDPEMNEIRHSVEKRMLMKHITELNDIVLSLKLTINKLNNDREERMEIQKKLQEELQTLRVINNKLEKINDTVIETEVDLRIELEREKISNDKRNKYWKSAMKNCEEEKEILVMRNKELQEELQVIKTNVQLELEREKIAKDNLNKYWELKMKSCEEEKEILAIRIQELEKELEAIKTSVPVQNLQLVGGSSLPQQDLQCEIDTADDGKMSLQNFQFVRRLGEGGFGTVVLAKGKLVGGPEQLYAIKALKKRGINSSNICEIMAEKEALMLTSGHPFITTLYSCFQNKNHIFFCDGVYEWR